MVTITATYSPEDNKIRLYASSRLDAETYARVKEAGFKWAPRQELFVAPKWTPAREDLALELAGDIEPEEMTLAERAAAKAERLEGLAKKRYAEANAYSRRANELSEAFYMGQPILVGHHSERKARKTQERMHSAQDQACKAERAAGYWLYRATGVECFANMKNDPRVRTNRIKTLLAELRDLQRAINTAHGALELWAKITTDEQIKRAMVSIDYRQLCLGWGMWDAVDKGEITPQTAREKAIANAELISSGPTRRRWIEHVLNRLSFERSMLGDVPRYEGEITPVILQAFAREHGAEKPVATTTDEGSFQLESPVPLPAHISDKTYLDLTADDWRDLMQSVGYVVPEKKARRASSKPAPMPLINLTEEQAEQLQNIWNLQMAASCKKYQTPEPNSVKSMTQAAYAAHSKGTYAPFKTVEIDSNGKQVSCGWRGGQFVQTSEPVARIRIAVDGSTFYKAPAIIHISDKPSKPLPVDLDIIEEAAKVALKAHQAELAA